MPASSMVWLAAALALAASSPAVAQAPSGAPSSPMNPSAEQGTTTEAAGSTQMDATEKKARSALEQAGYTDVRDVRSSAEGVSAKAVKNGKQVSLVIDSAGKIMERGP